MTFNIYGCCISREPVEALMKKRNDISVNQYIAFINPIALCSDKNTRKINIDELNDLQTSNFRKRNLCLDVNGAAFDYLFAKESDYIIIDTWDFRQPMIEKNGCYITVDPTTIRRNEKINGKFGWSEHRHIFHYQISDEQYDAAIDELCRRVLEHYRPEQVILMDSYGVRNYFDEKERKIHFFKQADLDVLDKTNARAKANFERLRNNFGNCHVVDFPGNNTVYGASDAKWGIMFLHYWELYYEYAADSIDVILHKFPRSEETERLDKLKKQYEIDANIRTKSAIIVSKNADTNTNNIDAEGIGKMCHGEIVDKMCNTRDINVYLKCLENLKDELLIVLSTRHTPGNNIPNDVVDSIHALGFTYFTKTSLNMYTGVVSQGKEIFNKSSKKAMDPVEFNGTVDGINLSVISRSWTGGLLSRVEIDGDDYSLNGRGLNIVVYDWKNNAVIDSCNYDAFTDNPTFFHKNLLCNEKYFDEHFFVREKYKDVWYAPYKKRYFSNRILSVKEIENGIILPNKEIDNAVYGGVCTENFEFVSGCKTIMPDINSRSRHIVGSYKFPEKELTYVDDVVVYAGTLMDHPGHLICEAITDRIWWYTTAAEKNVKVAVVCIWGDSEYRFQREFLRQFGFKDEEIIFVDKPTKFRKVIVPDQSEYLYRTTSLIPYEYTRESVSVIERLKDKAPEFLYKKVYFTKSKTQKGNIVGEDFFIDFFRNRGFKIIDPEDYSLNEKIGFLKNADEFVSLFGTNTCYAIFCKPSVKITILSRNTGSLMETQAMINEAAGIRECICVDTSLNIFGGNLTYGLTFVGVTDCFRKYVKYYFNEDLDFTVEDFMKTHLYEFCKRIPEYYSNPKCFDFIKNQKMLRIIQNISELCLNTEFDTSDLDLTTEEDKLNGRIKQLTTDIDTLRRRITELESTDINKAAGILQMTNSSLEKQICELQNTIQQMSEQQTRIDELVSEKHELEKSLVHANNTLQIRSEELRSKQNQMSNLSIQLQQTQRDNFEMQKQISNFEKSCSWKITKPLRVIVRIFRKEK